MCYVLCSIHRNTEAHNISVLGNENKANKTNPLSSKERCVQKKPSISQMSWREAAGG